MVKTQRISLKQARDKGLMDQFIKAHEAAPQGNADTFNRAVRAMAQKSTEAPKTSSPSNLDD